MATKIDLDNIKLSKDQEAALDAFVSFLADDSQQVFVLEGYSGCGKSTLVRVMLDQYQRLNKMIHLINPSAKDYDVILTATTNKAAENLESITGMEVRTIHSVLGLRVETDFKTGKSTLSPVKNFTYEMDALIIIDEASNIDRAMLQYVFTRTKNCKIMFIGDPCQTLAVGASSAVVFDAGYDTAALKEVVRQQLPDGSTEVHPITAVGALFRETVKTGVWTPFNPNGEHIILLDRADFEREIYKEFCRKDWTHDDSKILSWTNKTAIAYNQMVAKQITGDPNFQVGDYAMVNEFVNFGGGLSLKTDQMVRITSIERDDVYYGVPGNWITVNGNFRAFHPKSLSQKRAAIRAYRQEENYSDAYKIETTWLDLRAVYSSTVNKAQGSTYDKVFIDIDDIAKCRQPNQVARMLYVALTRARHKVYLCGDLV